MEAQVNFKQLLNNVKVFVFDVDGVLTDGSITLMPDGEQIRKMNIKDGYALQLAIHKGYKIAIISGGKSESVRKRLNGLGITEVFLGCDNKLETYNEFLLTHTLDSKQVLYMGDDMPDYEVMQHVGVATCPEDAAPEIKSISLYTSSKKGGEGCVRDVIEQVMKLHGNWNTKEQEAEKKV